MNRNMRKLTGVIIGIVLVLCSCGPKKPTVAELRQQKHVEDSLSLIAQESSLAYYDSLLQALLPQVDPMLKSFKYIKDERYENHGHYIHKLLQSTSNTSRNFVQAIVNDDFTANVKCFYYGAGKINIQSVTLEADSMQANYGGSSFAFESEGWHETLTLSGENAREFLKFIDAYPTSRICVVMQGAKTKYRYYLSENDRKALMETHQLITCMSDVHQLEQMVRQTSLQIEKYQKRLEKH